MTELLILWNQAGGAVPGGLWPLLLLSLFLAFLFLRMLPGTGVFGERGPVPALLLALALLIAAHLILRTKLTPRPGEAVLSLWPVEGLPAARALSATAEVALSREHELCFADRDLRLQVNRAFLPADLFQPRDKSGIDRLMKALAADVLVNARLTEDTLVIQAWERVWSVTRQLDQQQLPLDGESEEARVLSAHTLYDGFIRTLLQHEFVSVSLPASDLPLYGAVVDSTETYLALPAEPGSEYAAVRMASLRFHLGVDEAQVVEVINAGLEQGDEAGVDLWLLAAEWFAARGEWEQVIQALENAMAVDPAHPQIYWMISHLNRDARKHFGFYDEPAPLLRGISLHPAYLPTVYRLCERLSAHRRKDEAASYADVAMMICPRDSELRLQRANLALSLMQHGYALQLYQGLCTEFPRDPRAFINLGQLYYMLQEYEAAIAPLTEAVALGAPPKLLHILGVCYDELGQDEQAVHYYRRRMQLGGDRQELEATRLRLAAHFPEMQPEVQEEARP